MVMLDNRLQTRHALSGAYFLYLKFCAGFRRASERNLEWQLQQQLTRSTTQEVGQHTVTKPKCP
jgi:hypothetical protein